MTRKLTKDEAIVKAIAVHGDRYVYDERTFYVNLRTPWEVFCRSCGEYFWIRPLNHFDKNNRSGCPRCARAERRMTVDEFVDRARTIYGDTIDYSEATANFVHSTERVPLRCNVCEHRWMSLPSNHLDGRSGCVVCANKEKSVSQSLGFDEFVRRACEVHGDVYEYPPQEYVNNVAKVKIWCSRHEGFFWQAPASHIGQKAGCPCHHYERVREKLAWTFDEFVKRAREVHGERYSYPSQVYMNSMSHLDLECSEHGVFRQTPVAHVYHEQGCPACHVRVSRVERRWLSALGVPDDPEHRQIRVGPYTVDGLLNDVVYEFYGTYWHGDPRKYAREALNKKNGLSMGLLYDRAILKHRRLEELGYQIKFVWELDFDAGLLLSSAHPHELLRDAS